MSIDLTGGKESAGGILRWFRRTGIERKLAVLLLVAALVSGLATYLAMTGAFDIRPEPFTILVLLLINLAVLLMLGTVVTLRLAALEEQRSLVDDEAGHDEQHRHGQRRRRGEVGAPVGGEPPQAAKPCRHPRALRS